MRALDKTGVTLVPGDGIGMEISEAAWRVIEASGAEIEWDFECAGEMSQRRYGELINSRLLESIARNKVVLKGPLATPKGRGHKSLNVYLRKRFSAYAGLRPVKSFKGVKTSRKDVDVVVIRENIEGLYSGKSFGFMDDKSEIIRRARYTSGNITHATEIPEGAAVAFQVITKSRSLRVARFAFDYARKNGRKKIGVLHKANINKETEGLFLRAAQEVAPEFPDIDFSEVIVDDCLARIIQDPGQFDILLCINEHGDMLSSAAAGLVGGVGLVGSGNIGDEFAIFEALHGTAPDIAGQNKANPSAMIISGAMMLRHIGENNKGDAVEEAVRSVVREGKYLTRDIAHSKRQSVSTEEFGEAVIEKLP